MARAKRPKIEPGPGRETADDAFHAATQRIAEHNAAAQASARKTRTAREKAVTDARREFDRR